MIGRAACQGMDRVLYREYRDERVVSRYYIITRQTEPTQTYVHYNGRSYFSVELSWKRKFDSLVKTTGEFPFSMGQLPGSSPC